MALGRAFFMFQLVAGFGAHRKHRPVRLPASSNVRSEAGANKQGCHFRKRMRRHGSAGGFEQSGGVGDRCIGQMGRAPQLGYHALFSGCRRWHGKTDSVE